jgi:hypothetical protein
MIDSLVSGDFNTVLQAHNELLGAVWNKAAAGMFSRPEFTDNPTTEAQKLENQLWQIFYLGEKLNIPANGLIGYYALSGTPFADRIPIARDNMLKVIQEQWVKPANGYCSDLNPHVNSDGVLIDGNEKQAFCAPLVLGSAFEAAGNYGPFWVIFDHETLASDRRNGISGDHHSNYLVPTDIDKSFLLHKGEMPLEIQYKIITYQEFLQLHQGDLPDASEMRKHRLHAEHRERIRQAVKGFEDQAKASPNWEFALNQYLNEINNTDLDPRYRLELVRGIKFIPSRFRFEPTTKKIMEIAKPSLLSIAFDSHQQNELRISCLYEFVRKGEELLSEDEIQTMLKMTLNHRESREIRGALIDIISQYTYADVPHILVKVARDAESDVGLQHHALLNSFSSNPETVQTIIEFLQYGNEQGQKIAMKTLAPLPVFDPGEALLNQVLAFAARNTRMDIVEYIEAFLDKYSYILCPEQYRDFTPANWGEFANTLNLLVADFKFGEDNRGNLRKGLQAFLYREFQEGRITLSDITPDSIEPNSLVIDFNHGNYIGMITANYGMCADFGGYAYPLGKTDKTAGEHLKRIVRV